MKINFAVLSIPLITASLVCGCGKTEPTPGADANTTTPAAPAAATPQAAPATTVTLATVQAGVKPVTEAAKSADSGLMSQLVQKVAAQKDTVLSSVATDLVGKVQSLGAAVGANEAVKTQLNSTMQSLLGGMDADALTTAYKVVEAAKLTPEQISLAKEVGNLASAFVVQRNFAALDGAQGDVATIVNSLRKGELLAAAPAIQKVYQNTNLTSVQKDLISSIADKYAPGLKAAAGSLQQGLQSIKQLPGLGK